MVEGEWKNFVFKVITSENKARVYEHLRNNFYDGEPICNYFGGCTELCAKEFENFYDEVIPLNLSFLAEDKETQEVCIYMYAKFLYCIFTRTNYIFYIN